MSHVVPGSVAKRSRLESATERLEEHLSNHAKHHAMENVADQDLVGSFQSHDKCQKEELKRLKESLK